MTTAAEREVFLANTQEWIDSDPISLVLSRKAEQDDGAGGTVTNDVDLAPQTFRMDRRSAQGVSETVSPEGTRTPVSFRLVGREDADVQKGDTFTLNGVAYEIQFVNRKTFGRTAAEVEHYG